MQCNIRTGDLLFFRPTGWIGRLICRLTRSEYCHVGIAEIVKGIIYIAEYREFGFRYEMLRCVEKEWGLKADVYRAEWLNSHHAKRVVDYMTSNPQRYGYWHIIASGLLRLFPVYVGKWLVHECERHSPHCSEAVCRAMKWATGIDLVPGIPDWHTSPGDVVKAGKVVKING